MEQKSIVRRAIAADRYALGEQRFRFQQAHGSSRAAHKQVAQWMSIPLAKTSAVLFKECI